MDALKPDISAIENELDGVRDDAATLDADYERCAEITRRSRSSFYYAFILLPPERRRALNAVYAFCRFIDDIADDESIREPAILLTRWREELDRVLEEHRASRAAQNDDTRKAFWIRITHLADQLELNPAYRAANSGIPPGGASRRLTALRSWSHHCSTSRRSGPSRQTA